MAHEARRATRVVQAGGGRCGLGASPPSVRKSLGWPKRCTLAHAFLWEYSDKRLKLTQLMGQLTKTVQGWPKLRDLAQHYD
jgi:hypothetical protein